MKFMLAWTDGWSPAIGEWLEGHPSPERVDVGGMLFANQGAFPPAVRGMRKEDKRKREALPGWERYWRRCRYSEHINW